MLHSSCNIGPRALPDMYALALGHRACISGNALVPMLQLLNVLVKTLIMTVTYNIHVLHVANYKLQLLAV